MSQAVLAFTIAVPTVAAAAVLYADDWIAATLMLIAAVAAANVTRRSRLVGLAACLSSACMGLVLAFAYFLQGRGVTPAFLYHLRADLLYAGIGEFAIPLILAAAYLMLVTALAWRTSPVSSTRMRTQLAALALVIVAVAIHPLSVQSAWMGWQRSEPSTLELPKGPNRIDPMVRDRPLLTPRAERPYPNLVLIFAESLEATYFDLKATRQAMAPLKAWRERSINFSNVHQAPYAGWTIGGFVGALCGWPLDPPGDIQGDQAGGLNGFYEPLMCLPDILKRFGYRLEYANGANLRFAGKGEFLRKHGFDALYGRQYFADGDKAPMSHWGLRDGALFSFLRQRFDKLRRKPWPFVLMGLTLKTHHPQGLPGKACRRRYPDYGSMTAALACSAEQIAAFIDYVRHRATERPTIVAVASDHLAMRNSLWETLEQAPARRNLFFVNLPDGSHQQISRPLWQYDIGATLLDLMLGLDQLNVGRSGLAKTASHQSAGQSLIDSAAFQALNNSLWGADNALRGSELTLSDFEARSGLFQGMDLSAQGVGERWAYAELVLDQGAWRLRAKARDYSSNTLTIDNKGFPARLWLGVPARVIADRTEVSFAKDLVGMVATSSACVAFPLPTGELEAVDLQVRGDTPRVNASQTVALSDCGIQKAKVELRQRKATFDPLTDLTSTAQRVQLLYVAYFNRAGDPKGLQNRIARFHALRDQGLSEGEALRAMAANFAGTAEARNNFPFLASGGAQGSPKDLVTNVFQVLFDRAPTGTVDDPDTALGFWVDWVERAVGGQKQLGQVILDIATGARKEDKSLLWKKIHAAMGYTSNLETPADFNKQAGREVLARVERGMTPQEAQQVGKQIAK